MSSVSDRMYASLRGIYRPRYMALNIAVAILYYYVFSFLIRYQNYGILLVNVPAYLEYAMIATASVLLTISVYSIRNTLRNRAKVTASSLSAVTLVLGGALGGCGCAQPLIMGLAAFGISSSSLFSANAVLTSYTAQIFIAMIAVNVALTLYYLNKLSTSSCRIRPAKKR
ncbi:MAG: hypothetical protein M1321_00340 [Candidatus Marsarchaeota archaeon]|nr:hypothetical protein [Candidatus Marsarchaeota archaeon]